MAAGYCGATNTDLQTTTTFQMCNYFHLLFFSFFSLSLPLFLFPFFFLVVRSFFISLQHHRPMHKHSCTISKYNTDVYQTFSISYNSFFFWCSISLLTDYQDFNHFSQYNERGKNDEIFTVYSH